MRGRLLLGSCVLLLLVAAGAGCRASGPEAVTPGLAARGTPLTTAKPARQDLDNRVSLAGRVTMNPLFGVVAPVAGQIRYRDVDPPEGTPTRPTRVASIWAGGKSRRVDVPSGSVFAGRLMDDRSTVTAGMPVVSARRIGYGLVAEIDGAQAYQISDSLTSVQAQIKNGPGPFACKVLGTIAALPAGTVPEPPAREPSADSSADPSTAPVAPVRPPAGIHQQVEPSEPTGMRLVCTAPPGIKLINGASATLEVVTARAENALVLPVEAVAGGQGNGKVDVVGPDGGRETRDVVLGLSDGKVVQITSGLTGDETVAVPGPNLPPAEPAEPGQPGRPAGPMGGK
ncbi:efflux RND transporter periplasmic adaptor subunit [Plantactinospora sp. WMMC1484]|uniref:efflux RND transporter periplasmic adaptor subunit n=1 Tax=Plantactinospora sp. WMMC1484 TaxID=3404122 RepID=UPI003BF57402